MIKTASFAASFGRRGDGGEGEAGKGTKHHKKEKTVIIPALIEKGTGQVDESGRWNQEDSNQVNGIKKIVIM